MLLFIDVGMIRMTTEYHAKCGCGAEIALLISNNEYWSFKGVAFDKWLKTHADCIKQKTVPYRLKVKRGVRNADT